MKAVYPTITNSPPKLGWVARRAGVVPKGTSPLASLASPPNLGGEFQHCVRLMILLSLLVLPPVQSAFAQRPPAITPPPAVQPPPPGMTLTTRLDRTAVWVGDQFHYLIMVEYSTDYEFVLDNLTKETVNMDPFQVVDVSKNVVVQNNNRRKLFVDLTLANFSTGESLQIPQFTLYYFEKSKTVSVDQAAAESLTVPGPVIGIRSTLLPKPTDIRDAVTLN